MTSELHKAINAIAFLSGFFTGLWVLVKFNAVQQARHKERLQNQREVWELNQKIHALMDERQAYLKNTNADYNKPHLLPQKNKWLE